MKNLNRLGAAQSFVRVTFSSVRSANTTVSKSKSSSLICDVHTQRFFVREEKNKIKKAGGLY